MDISRLLRNGDEVLVSAGDVHFVTKVFDVTGEASFSVLRQIGIAPPEPGDIYSATCVTERGIYIFKTEVAGICESPAVILLKAMNECVKLQRRSTFRVRETLPVRVLVSSGATSPDWVETTTVDISESGVFMKYGSKCAIGQKLKLIIHIDRLGMDVFLPTVKGKVVRCLGTDGEDSGYLLGVKFEDPPERAKNEIMRFVVLSQRNKMKSQRYRGYGE